MGLPAISTGSQAKLRKPQRTSVAALALGMAALALVAHADPKLLPPQEAFRFSARIVDAKTIPTPDLQPSFVVTGSGNSRPLRNV